MGCGAPDRESGAVRVRLRAALTRLERRAPQSIATVHVQGMDDDGDRCWFNVTYQPDAEELRWALSDTQAMRGAHAVYSCLKVREMVEANGLTLGWTPEEE